MITRCSLTKWILSEAFLLALAVHPVVNQKDSSACCYADAQSERSILRDSSLTDEQRKVHYQKLRYLRDEKRKNSATDTSSVRNDNSASQKKPQKQRLPSIFVIPAISFVILAQARISLTHIYIYFPLTQPRTEWFGANRNSRFVSCSRLKTTTFKSSEDKTNTHAPIGRGSFCAYQMTGCGSP